MNEEDPESRSGVAFYATLVLGFVLLLFLPLGIAGFEYYVLKSTHFESFCRQIGIHPFLDRIYRPIFHFF